MDFSNYFWISWKGKKCKYTKIEILVKVPKISKAIQECYIFEKYYEFFSKEIDNYNKPKNN